VTRMWSPAFTARTTSLRRFLSSRIPIVFTFGECSCVWLRCQAGRPYDQVADIRESQNHPTSRWRPIRRSTCNVNDRNEYGLFSTHSAHKPAIIRSETDRMGDRFRDRLRISSWCLMSTDSATTERAPPGPASRATVAKRCRTRTARSRTAHASKIATPGNARGFSHNGTTGSNSQLVDYAASWKHCTTQSHMRRSRP
jgi:hypothetical protein